jgi:hypothetical protein
MNSFLHSEIAKRHLANKPVAIFAACRAVYKPHLKQVTEAIQALGGRVVASEFFPFTGGAVSTSLSWLHYMMAGVQKERWLGLRLSPYGCSEATLQKASAFVARFLAALPS